MIKNIPKLYVTTAFIIILFIGCNNDKTTEATLEPAQIEVTKESDNEALMDSLMQNLSEIEYYFVNHRSVFNDKNSIDNNLLSLLKYKNDPHYDQLKNNHTSPSKIIKLDAKNGYLVVEETPESISYFTYWNLTDGSGNKLFANVGRGCGPQCTDDIWFYKIINANSEGSKYLFEEVNANDIIKNFDKLPEILIGHEIDDYYPISINLPQVGKNISMCLSSNINLTIEDDDTLERKGNCIELVWNGEQGTFTAKEQTKK